MRYLAGDRWQLGSYTLPMKLALSFFLLFMLLGLASSIALYHNQFDFSASTAADYYQGNSGDMDARTMYVKKSYRELLETAHFHLYIMPVVYLALVHLYFLTQQSNTLKVIMTILTFVGLLVEVAAPWLVRYGPGWTSYLFYLSGMAITVPTVWMCGVCLFELWFVTEETS
ncbi:MAG: hypothetical protein ABEK50_06595 [bacterium]